MTRLYSLSQLSSLLVGFIILLGCWFHQTIVLVSIVPKVPVILLLPVSAEPWWVDISACKSVTSRDKAGISPGPVAL
jgi:hypothetical protein